MQIGSFWKELTFKREKFSQGNLENFLKHELCIKRKEKKIRPWPQCLKPALKCLILHGNELKKDFINKGLIIRFILVERFLGKKNAKNKSQYQFAF